MNIENKDFSTLILEKSLDYLNKITDGYTLTDAKCITHDNEISIASINYSYVFNYDKKNMQVNIVFTEYRDGEMIFDFHIENITDKEKHKCDFDLEEYLFQYTNNNPINNKKYNFNDHFVLTNFAGDNLEEKLDLFFDWLWCATDEQLIKILKGEEQIYIPYDWRDQKVKIYPNLNPRGFIFKIWKNKE